MVLKTISDQEKKGLTNLADAIYERCKRDPYYWMVNFAYTLNEHDGLEESTKDNDGIENFPDMPYIEEIVRVWLNEPKLLVPKSRQMMCSWVFVALYLWWAMFYPGKRIAFQSKKKEDADSMIKRAKFIYDHQPKFLKRNPINPTMRGRDIFARINFPGKNTFVPDHNSYLEAIGQGPDQTRGKTYSGFFCDEMAFQDEAQTTYISLMPTLDRGAKFTGISSAAAETFFKKLVFDELT